MHKSVLQFLTHLSHEMNLSQHTIRGYASDLSHFKRYIEEQVMDLSDKAFTPPFPYKKGDKGGTPTKVFLTLIDKGVIRAYISYSHFQKFSKTTIRRRLACLGSYFKFLMAKKLVKSSPIELIDRPKLGKPLPRALSLATIETLFKSVDTSDEAGMRDRAILELFFSSALRLSELIAINLEHIDFHEGLLKVMGKGKKERVVPMTREALSWIQRYLKGAMHTKLGANLTGPLFLNKFGTRLTGRSVDRLVKKYLLKSGLYESITPHAIRHSIATLWLEQGMDLKTIQKLLGHSSLQATQIYTKVSKKVKEEVYDRAHPRAKG